MMMKWLPIFVIVLLFVSPRATSRDIPNTPLDQTVLHANAPAKAESPSDSNGLGDKKNFIYGGVGGFAGMGGYAGVNGVLPTLGGSGSFNKFGGIGGAGGIGGVAGIGGLPGTTGGLPGGLGGGFPTMGGVAVAPPGGGILHP